MPKCPLLQSVIMDSIVGLMNHLLEMSTYRTLSWYLRTTKLVMTDLRRSMYPRNLEMLMFLRANRHLWDEVVVQRAILRDEA